MADIFTREEVAKHNTVEDLWIIIDNFVYDVTKFAKFHPGGLPLLLRNGGKDVTDEYKSYHNDYVLQKYDNLKVGQIVNTEHTKAPPVFEYAEPLWYSSGVSPYYNESHRKFQQKMRTFVDTHIIPYCHDWDSKGAYPPELRTKAYDEGIYGAIWPKEYGGTPPEGAFVTEKSTTVVNGVEQIVETQIHKADPFHLLIFVDELSRCGAGGVLWSCFFSFSISLPPILNVGSQFIKDLVARDVITGKKILSLAVTEPAAGSDVAALQTTAVLRESAAGEEVWVVNGEKRYITGGVYGDYYTTAVRTKEGITLLLIPRETKGVTVRRQPTQGWLSSNTAFIQFHEVEIPKNYIIGEPGKGWTAIYKNFNQERVVLAAQSNRYARMCMSDAVDFCRHRVTMRQKMSNHQVIRFKVAAMCQRVESTHALLEQICFEMKSGRTHDIGGRIALAKNQATETMRFCTTEATQILGGVAYIRGGIGHRIERLSREVNVQSIGGGSFEVLYILAMSQAKL